MSEISELPEILNLPPKLLPMVRNFNKYRYFLIEGGRGSGKTHGIARLISYIGEKRLVRTFCGRETQNTIEESVYTVFKDLISGFGLNYQVFRDRIRHRTTESEVRFKGFREQGSVNIKGMEGVDILWIDEAQAITQQTLDIIIPTIRKQKSKVIFSLNRYQKNDPVYREFANREDCLHIQINYNDNPFCPQVLIDEAKMCQRERPEDYRHIWLGEPLAQADNYLFPQDALDATLGMHFPHDASKYQGIILAGDVARFGDNYSVGIVLKQCGPRHWEELAIERWKNHDIPYTAGRFASMMHEYNPDHTVIDGDGLGGGVVDILRNQRKPIVEFRGGMNDKIDKDRYKNWRTYGYLTLSELVANGWLRLKSQFIIDQLKEIQYRYDNSLRKFIIPKEQLIEAARKKGIKFDSPDDADALMMAATMIATVEQEQTDMYTQQHQRQPRGRPSSYAYEEPLI